MSPAPGELYIGLISGTSADGIDAALCRFDPAPELLGGLTWSYPAAVREAIVSLSQSNAETKLDSLGELDHDIALSFAAAANALLEKAGVAASRVRAIGSHGQTLRHRPDGQRPFTWQMGDPSLIAERTGCTVVADFRRRDMAAGGQGAPLLPGLHADLLRCADETRGVLNLGGIANLTLLPRTGPVRGFDTGPANCLLDAWHARHRRDAYDVDGRWAASGKPDAALLERLLDEPWFARRAPKSTGREVLNLDWLAMRGGERIAQLSAVDVQATLLALTTTTITSALLREQPETQRLLVCGGGVHNPTLLAALRAGLPGVIVESSAVQGVDPDLVEAMGFAWLAHATLAGRSGNLPEVTGATGQRILGGIYPA